MQKMLTLVIISNLINFNAKITDNQKQIKKFNKVITVSGDKSISIRWVLFSSLANGIYS